MKDPVGTAGFVFSLLSVAYFVGTMLSLSESGVRAVLADWFWPIVPLFAVLGLGLSIVQLIMHRTKLAIAGVIIGVIMVAFLAVSMTRSSRSAPWTHELCDMDLDWDCDETDKETFTKSLGKCRGHKEYNPMADFNGDGCVTQFDMNFLFP